MKCPQGMLGWVASVMLGNAQKVSKLRGREEQSRQRGEAATAAVNSAETYSMQPVNDLHRRKKLYRIAHMAFSAYAAKSRLHCFLGEFALLKHLWTSCNDACSWGRRTQKRDMQPNVHSRVSLTVESFTIVNTLFFSRKCWPGRMCVTFEKS